jgi:hypothetical protein
MPNDGCYRLAIPGNSLQPGEVLALSLVLAFLDLEVLVEPDLAREPNRRFAERVPPPNSGRPFKPFLRSGLCLTHGPLHT